MARDRWRSSADSRSRSTERGVTPTIGKTLEIGIAVLLLAVLTTALYGNLVPSYRTTAGAQIAERTLAGVGERIEHAVPPSARVAVVDRRVPVPQTIRGRTYRITAQGTRLRLVHPHPAIGSELRLVVPERVTRVTGSWNSADTTRVRMMTTDDGLRIRLVNATTGAWNTTTGAWNGMTERTDRSEVSNAR